MPKGVYARKSAQPSATGRKKPAAGAAAKKGRTNNSKQAPKPASKKADSPEQAQELTQKVTPPSLPPAPSIVAAEFKVAPAFHRHKSVPVDDLAGNELRQYARGLGISQRDVDGLSEDRLRQNCKVRIFESMED